MGYNARNDEIRDNITRMRCEWEAQRNALATVRRFNATLSAKGYVGFCSITTGTARLHRPR
ncbi:MAG: hypothetical protein WCB22_26230, partial [Pseudolabrys sp.]